MARAPQRPAAVTVVAILNFIFGGFGLFGLLCGGLGLLLLVGIAQNAAPPPGGGPDPFKELKEMGGLFQSIPGYTSFMIVSSLLGAIFAILLIVSGFGLLKMRGWAKTIAVIYAIYTIFGATGGLVYSLAVVNPATEKWMADKMQRPGMPPQPPPSNIGGVFGAVVATIFNIGYAVLILVLLNLASVRAAFARAAAGLPADDPEDDYDDRRRSRDDDDRRRDDRDDDPDDRIQGGSRQ